jgi:MscS family membrane protein
MHSLIQYLLASFKSQDWIFQIFLTLAICSFLTWLFLFINRRLKPRFARSVHLWDSAFLDAVHRPLIIYVWMIAVGILFNVLNQAFFHHVLPWNKGLYFKLMTEVFVFWVILRFITKLYAAIVVFPTTGGGKKFDKSMAAAFCQLLRILVLVIGVLIVLPTLDISISALLTFGGVGTVVLGFAAKDTLANFLGGMMIFVDRPFSVGDWIRSPDREIEGTVEHIGWRLTRIRRFNMRPLYVPNGLFSTICVETPSRMLNRRIKVSFGIRFCDYKKMKTIADDVETMLRNHDDIDTSRTLFVKFHEVGPSSIKFLVYTFTKTIRWVEFQDVQQNVLLKIIDIIDRHGAECAFPTRTLSIPDTVRFKEEGELSDA